MLSVLVEKEQVALLPPKPSSSSTASPRSIPKRRERSASWRREGPSKKTNRSSARG